MKGGSDLMRPRAAVPDGWMQPVHAMSKFVILYRLSCCIIALTLLLAMSGLYPGSPWLSSSFFCILFFAAASVSRFFRGTARVRRWLAVSDYFFVLLNGYFMPEMIILEFLFLPAILMDIVFVFPFIQAVALELALGIFGSVAFSNNILSGSRIVVNEASFPLSAVTGCFYTPLALGLIVIAAMNAKREQEARRLRDLDDLNHRLEIINRDINQKLFGIQQDSSQEERMRITKEIHDTSGYVFINIIMLLQAAMAVLDKDRKLGEAKINDALEYTRRGINQIRYILREMRSYEKPSLGLQNELYDIARLFTKATGVTVNMEYGNWRKTFGAKMDVFFTSFLQESLTNALKYGRATVVDMNCWETDRDVIISVQDNGKGFTEPLKPGIGITGIKDFVESRAGSVEIRPTGSGVSIKVTIPVASLESAGEPSWNN